MARKTTRDTDKPIGSTGSVGDPHAPVEVLWEDASSHDPGWIPLKEASLEIAEVYVTTIGYIAARDDKALYLSMNKTDGFGGPYMRIPKGMIRKVTALRSMKA